MALNTLKMTSSSYTLTFNFPLSTSMMTSTIFIKGLPRMRGTFRSSSISIITMSIRNYNLSTLTSRSSTMPYGYLIDLSTNWSVILVG